jgi:poly-gamma-glutamate system protein
MTRRRGFLRAALPAWYLVAALAVVGLGQYCLARTRTRVPYPRAELAIRAARRMEEAERALKAALLAEGIPIEAELDPNATGLIGPEWSELTTTLGSLEAKRSVLNPNFAALMVRYFSEAGLEAGDTVAVGASGSFPGLVIATLCAAREMDLRVLTIASFGSSMYGATRPAFTVPKMIRILAAASIVPDSLIAVSPGGDDDHGESAMYDDARAVEARLAAEAGVEYIDLDPPDLEASIARRLALYETASAGRRIACFVNIGGASPNSGTTSYTLDFPQGLVLDPPRIPTSADRGLNYEFAARGLPVINLLNIRLLAEKNGLPFDPVPLPRPGEGGVYGDSHAEPLVLVATLALALGFLAVYSIKRGRSLRAEREARAAP